MYIRVKWSEALCAGALLVNTLLGGMGCQMDNPRFKLGSNLGDDCESQGAPGCDQRLEPQDVSGSGTHGAVGETDFHRTTQGSTTGPVEQGASSSQSASSSRNEESSESQTTSQTTTTTQFENLPDYPLGCVAKGIVNCFTMKFDASNSQFVRRGDGMIELSQGNASSALQLRSTTEFQSHFRHSWVTQGQGYGLLSAPFSTTGFFGIGLEVMVQKISCVGTGICFFAGYEDLLSLGYDPTSSSVFCEAKGAESSVTRVVSPDGEIRIACSLRDGVLQLRIDGDAHHQLNSAEYQVSAMTTRLLLGPSLRPTVNEANGFAGEFGWVRIWSDGRELENLTDD